MTQIQLAKKKKITEEMRIMAKEEGLGLEELRKRIAKDLVVIPANKEHKNLKLIGLPDVDDVREG